MKSLKNRCILALIISFALSVSISHANPAPSQVYYVPFPEDNQLAGYLAITTGNGTAQASDPLAVFVSFSASADNTVIYYDHWEDGYEQDISRPKQSTTLVFGDGDPSNGYPPGNAGDLISAGTFFSLRNYVTSTTMQSVLDYDARDKIASFKPISVTKTTFPASTNTLLAGCVEVFEKGLWGTEYRVPVGVNMPSGSATSTLTWDADIFSYTALSIMAGAGGATVQIDADNNGTFEQTVTLVEGQTSYVTDVSAGARVLSDKAVQVILFSGRMGSSYQSRDTSLLPTNRWSSSYYAPVSTQSGNETVVFLYNPSTSAITVSYDYRSSASAYVTATVNVPAGGNARVALTPNNSASNFGAYKFYTTGTTPPVFYAFCAIDANDPYTNSSGKYTRNQAYDGGFTLVGQPSLTTQVLVSLGIGRDPYSSTNLSENGNPVWITTAGNGHTAKTVYVDYNGDNAGALTDPNGNQYDISYSLQELQQQQLLDPDGDQSGMLVYVLDPNVKIAAAWAQDPSKASAAQPGLDVSTLVPPLREGDASKGSSVTIDIDGDGYRSAGDTLEYDIRTINTARTSINGPFTVKDNLPVDLIYVNGSTKYRYSVNGAWQAWVAVPDDGSGTAFPLDVSGFSVPGTLGVGQQIQVVFQATIKTYPNLTPGITQITNTGSVVVTPYGITVGLEWSDLIYGSIGDRVWVDSDGDGIQDGSEAGLNGIIVYADGNNNGVRDASEPYSVTSGDGSYLLPGLLAGNYIIRVDSASVAAINPGYGPTYDPDGITSSYVANVTLAAAQDRMDVDFGFRIGASIGDRVWVDRDNDGVQEPGEPGINGVRVFIDLNGNGSYDAGEPNSITFGDGSYFIGNLNAGTYSVCIDTSTLPAGTTQTFDYDGVVTANKASVTLLGAQHLAVLDFGYRGALSIGDLVWNDVDGNGTNTSESGIVNVKVYIDSNGNGVRDSTEAFATTNASGIYSITNLFNGTYTVRIDTTTLPNSMAQTYDLTSPYTDNQATVTLSGTSRTDVDFGYRDDATIGDRVWNDRNNDGVQDAGEPGIEGVLVYIDTDGDKVFDQGVERFSITDANGNYIFNNLAAGTYPICVEISTLPRGSTQTYDLDGTSTANAVSRTVTVSENATDVDFGYRSVASVGDFVWLDSDADGVQDAGEAGINGVRVYLDMNGNGVFDSSSEPSTVTDGNGAYTISGLVAGAYTARVDVSTLPAGMITTYDLAGDLDSAAAFMLAPSQVRVDVDFGYTQPVTIGDRVWSDLNANGVQDGGEPGLDGVAVTVYNATSNTIAGTTVTSGGGAYVFNNLLPGTYYVEFGAVPGYVRTPVDQGADNAKDSDANLLTGKTGNVTLTSGQSNLTLDAGYYQPAAISGFVLKDSNNDGVGDDGIQGVTVTLYTDPNNDGNPADGVAYGAAATTAVDGSYSFTNLPPGSYVAVETQPSGYLDVTDGDTSVDTAGSPADAANVTTDNRIAVNLMAGETDTANTFVEEQPGTVAGHLYIDTNNDGNQDVGEPDLANVNVIVTDSNGVAQTVSTDSSGNWSATVPPGSTNANVDESDPQYPTGYTQTEGTDPTTVVAAAGTNTDAGIDGYAPTSDLGIVKDVSNSTPLVGSQVVFTLVATNYGVSAATGVKVNDLLPDGYEFVSSNPGPFYDSGTGIWTIGSLAKNGSATLEITAKVLASGNYLNVATIDGDQPDPKPENDTDDALTTPIQLGSITGTVWEDTDNDNIGDTPIEGVIISLVDSSGNPVLGVNGQPRTATTGENGTYSFGSLPPGTYGVVEMQPVGYASLSDKDMGSDLDKILPITVTAGNTNTLNDFVEISRCPDTWADWKQLHPTETAAGNPDADAYDNFTDFAFAMPYDSGVGSQWLGSTAWVIQPTKPLDGTLEGVFIRPKGAPLNVTYTLEYAAELSNPTIWQSVVIDTGLTGNATTKDNSDCTETVTIHDLEGLTGVTGGKGVVRIKVELDDDGGNDEVDRTRWSEVEGWTLTDLEICCQTYNNPYQRETAFTGTVDSVNGQGLTFTGETFDTLLTSGVSYYLEVTSGDHEGARFDIVSASGDTLTLAVDSDLNEGAAPYNTLTGPLPSTLVGDTVAIHRHWTLGELFPTTGYVAAAAHTAADMIQTFANGVWANYYLYDDGALPYEPKWVKVGDGTMADQSSAILPPGAGLFVVKRNTATSILAYGEVRANDFVRPLSIANNFVGGGFPLDQSANDSASIDREMNLGTGFFGSRDFKTADSIMVWNGDKTPGANGYSTYYLLDNTPRLPAILKWVKQTDVSLLSRDTELLMRGDRSVFIRAKSALPTYTIPNPWTP